MRQLNFKLKKGVVFSLERILSKLKTDYPIPDSPKEGDFYFSGTMNARTNKENDEDYVEVSIVMSKKPDGWKAEADGTHTPGSDAEILQSYFDNLDETSDEATKYLSSEEKSGIIDRAKSDAASKTWDQLTAEQKKIVMNSNLSLADWDQLAIDFPEV